MAELSKQELIDSLLELLRAAPEPIESAPESGMTFEAAWTVVRRLLTGQCVAISRRAAESVLEALAAQTTSAGEPTPGATEHSIPPGGTPDPSPEFVKGFEDRIEEARTAGRGVELKACGDGKPWMCTTCGMTYRNNEQKCSVCELAALRTEADRLRAAMQSAFLACGERPFHERDMTVWRILEAALAPSAAPAVREEKATMTVGCHDCGRRYGDEHGFPDLVIPNDAWNRISPSGDDGGLLCPSCICKRLVDVGIREIEGSFMSGPIKSVDSTTMHNLRWIENLREQGHGWSCPTCHERREQTSPAQLPEAQHGEAEETEVQSMQGQWSRAVDDSRNVDNDAVPPMQGNRSGQGVPGLKEFAELSAGKPPSFFRSPPRDEASTSEASSSQSQTNVDQIGTKAGEAQPVKWVSMTKAEHAAWLNSRRPAAEPAGRFTYFQDTNRPVETFVVQDGTRMLCEAWSTQDAGDIVAALNAEQPAKGDETNLERAPTAVAAGDPPKTPPSLVAANDAMRKAVADRHERQKAARDSVPGQEISTK